jgi:hypothetical protein
MYGATKIWTFLAQISGRCFKIQFKHFPKSTTFSGKARMYQRERSIEHCARRREMKGTRERRSKTFLPGQ